jgi:hypothetical protein
MNLVRFYQNFFSCGGMKSQQFIAQDHFPIIPGENFHLFARPWIFDRAVPAF